ncbi:MAG: hypothetical protein Q8M26_10045 [Pseudolabrys sp.]|nr:hypothetical protein [Pseudolabrys sp.]
MWRSRFVGVVAGLVVGLSVAGCGNRGAAEFQLYSQSFNLQYEQGDAVLNALANAERTVVRRGLDAEKDREIFQPDRAAYFVDGLEPPITASIRASLKSIKAYNETLMALANGEAAEALTSRVGTITANLVGGIAASQAAFGGPTATAAATAMSASVGSTLKVILPIFQQAATYASREAFREQLVLAYPAMRDLLIKLRNGTPQIFSMMYRSHVQAGRLGVGRGGVSATGAAAVEKDRALVAGWVVLLDHSLIAMEAAVVAAMSDAPSLVLVNLSEASIELRVLAEKVKSARNKP